MATRVPLALMTVRGRVVLPTSLISAAGGSLTPNSGGGLLARGGGLVSRSGGGLVAGGGRLSAHDGLTPNSEWDVNQAGMDSRSARALQGLFTLTGIEGQPVTGISVTLADARGVAFRSLLTVLSDGSGAFEIPQVPRGLTYTVQAGLQTPKGDIQVASLVGSDKPVTVSVASTLVVEDLKRFVGEQWGRLDPAVAERAAGTIAQSLQPEDAQLAFTATLDSRHSQVLGRIKAERPELAVDLDSLANQIKEPSRDALTIAAQLRRRPDLVSSPVPLPQASSSSPTAPSTTPVQAPSAVPSASPVLSPSPGVFAVTTLAGAVPGNEDGTGTAAQFDTPMGIAVDSSGNVYVAEIGNHRIRKVSPAGVVTTLAGSTKGYADGMGQAARFSNPMSVTVDAAGNVYVADYDNHCIRRIDPAGLVTTLAGSIQGYADGTGQAARFNRPNAVAVDPEGNIFVADTGNASVRRISPAGAVTTLVGAKMENPEGYGMASPFGFIQGLAVDGAGNVYLSDAAYHLIYKVSPAGVVTLLAGSGEGNADGTGTTAQFSTPIGLAVSAAGDVYVGDGQNHRIRRVSPEGAVTTLAGSSQGYADGPRSSAQFSGPVAVAVDSAGTVFVADQLNHRIRRIQ